MLLKLLKSILITKQRIVQRGVQYLYNFFDLKNWISKRYMLFPRYGLISLYFTIDDTSIRLIFTIFGSGSPGL